MALSDLTVRQARTTGKRYTLSDNDCLGLMVSAAGGKSWMFRYYWLGKQKRMSLGGYPALSLREARAERDKAQALLARGVDPQIERDQRRHAAKLAGEYTFRNVFDAWVEHRRKELKEGRQSTLSQILRIFNKDVLPALGKMSIYDIRRPQLLGVLAAIEKRKAFTTAEKVRTWFNQMFRYALVVAEGLEVNPAADLDVVAEPKPPVTHNPYLHLTIRIDGVPAMAEVEEAVGAAPIVAEPPVPGVQSLVATPIVVTSSSGGITFRRLSHLPPPPVHVPEPEVSAIQREREEMLAIYESPNSLPVPLFGKLAGKSKDQINRELKAGKLLAISLGNRGQRVPDWQLVPLKHRLAQVLMNQCPHADSWGLYRMLTQPHPDLGDRAAIDAVTPTNVPAIVRVIMGDYQHHEDVPKAVAPQPVPEDVRQSVRRLVDSAVVIEGT